MIAIISDSINIEHELNFHVVFTRIILVSPFYIIAV